MKKVIVEVSDDTKSKLTEKVSISHFSDLSEGVKEVVDDFTEQNAGVLIPPITITAVEQKDGEQAS